MAKALNPSLKKLLYSIAVVTISVLLFVVFFYKLGEPALQSYDEAWYADITRNLLRSRNPLHLKFNKLTFIDHPPLGFWLMAIPTALLGSNELSARMIPALLGLLSLWLVFLVGSKLRDRRTGVAAALILFSSMWFMLRVRSGNLDSIFIFWELVVLYAIIKIQDRKNFLYVAAVGFGCLLLTKTLVGLGMLPMVILGLWLNKNKISKLEIVKALLLIIVLVSPWYIYNQWINSAFLNHHLVDIGMRGTSNIYSFDSIKQNSFYLQVGIGVWFKLLLVSLFGSLVLYITNISSRRKLLILLFGFSGFTLPFLFSDRTDVWHLLPTYPFIALIIAYVVQKGVDVLPNFFDSRNFLSWLSFIGIVSVGLYQFNQFSNLLYAPSTESSEKEISLQASKYDAKVYLMETFYPAAVYYSDQKVIPLHWDSKAYQRLKQLLAEQEVSEKVFIINQDIHNKLVEEEIDFETLAKSVDYLLIK